MHADRGHGMIMATRMAQLHMQGSVTHASFIPPPCPPSPPQKQAVRPGLSIGHS